MPLVVRIRLILLLILLASAVGTGVTAAPQAQASNGNISASQRAGVFIPQANSATLSKPAAAAWNTLRFCANRAGVDLYPLPSTFRPAATAYRSYAQQSALWQAYKNGTGNLAAYPGTSNHGWGRAIDLGLPRMRAWLDSHGRSAGWAKVEAPSEWWHVNFVLGSFSRPDPGTSLRYPRLQTGSGGVCLGPAVKELQRLLGVDQSGNFGDGTRHVLKDFQRAKFGRHSGTGVVGPSTWNALRARGVPKKETRPKYVQLTKPVRMRGQDVIAVQGLLNARRKEQAKPLVKVDGVWGTEDSQTLKNFQRSRHLDASGIAGEKTLRSLRIPEKKYRTAPVKASSASATAKLKTLGAKAGYSKTAKQKTTYGCAHVTTQLKRQQCKVRWLRAQYNRRLAYTKSIHGKANAKKRRTWSARTTRTLKSLRAAEKTLHTSRTATHISARGVQFVAGFEGLYHRCYNDPVGFATIGYGHLLHYSRCTAADNRLYWSTSRALSELRKSLGSFERAVRSAITVRLNQPQLDALTSFTYNVGEGALRGSTLRIRLNQGCYSCVQEELPRWSKAGGRTFPGLLRRRNAEAALFRSG